MTGGRREVTVIGGGLAGCEAAWQLAVRGADVLLFEMRPLRPTGAHRTGALAELVCSNSFKSNLPHTASGELKREMRHLGSVILDAADATCLPAGEALAVDRDEFAREVSRRLEETGRIRIERREVERLPEDGVVIVATGPLTSDALAADIARVTGSDRLFFYDAVAPIVDAETIDLERCFRASRYGRDGGSYLNCPLTEEEYENVWRAICAAETVPLHEFEDARFFEGCLPLEELARRGRDTLAHGPWKPVGLRDPRTGRRPHAVVQLRQENREATCYSMVACQSRMTWPEQRRIFRMIPGLENAEFLRLGVVHRNTYLRSPDLLDASLRLRSRPSLLFAGQLVGVEGYLESAAAGLVAGVNAWLTVSGCGEDFVPPPESMLGALLRYVSAWESPDFAPMNANFGILPPVERTGRMRKPERRAAACERAFQALCEYARSRPELCFRGR